MAHDVVEANVLEADLLDGLLEVTVVQDFQGVSIDEEHGVAFDLGMARLDEALITRFFSSLVAIET